MNTIIPHDTQLGGTENSIAWDNKTSRDMVGVADGKGSVSKILKNWFVVQS